MNTSMTREGGKLGIHLVAVFTLILDMIMKGGDMGSKRGFLHSSLLETCWNLPMQRYVHIQKRCKEFVERESLQLSVEDVLLPYAA